MGAPSAQWSCIEMQELCLDTERHSAFPKFTSRTEYFNLDTLSH